MALTAIDELNAEVAGLKEAVIAVFRQIEMRSPGLLDPAKADIIKVFDAAPAPEDANAPNRAVMCRTAIEIIEASKP